MKANEFIKKYGVGAAKNILHGMDDASEFTAHMPGDAWDKPTLIDAVGLRRLVESYELVEKLGGMEKCKMLIAEYGNSECADHLSYYVKNVESCQ